MLVVCFGKIGVTDDRFGVSSFSDGTWSSRANGHLKLPARYPTSGLTANRDALNQHVVATNYVPIVWFN